MNIINPVAKRTLLLLLVILPWIAMGMPLFSSNLANGIIFGSVIYAVSVHTGTTGTARTGWPFLLVGMLLGIFCLVADGPDAGGFMRRLEAFSGAMIGWGACQNIRQIFHP